MPTNPKLNSEPQAHTPDLSQLYSLPLAQVPIVVIDLETTGLHAHTDKICEVGAVKLQNGALLAEYTTLVNPKQVMTPEVIAIHNLTNEMLVDAPALSEILPGFLQFVGSSVIAGHNVGFDLSFLSPALRPLGVDWSQRPILDTAQLARRLLEAKGYALGRLAKAFDLPATQFHRALDDARTTGHLLFLLLEKLEEKGITTLAQLVEVYPFRGMPSASRSLSALEKTFLVAIEHSLPVEILYRNRSDEVRQRQITPERISVPYLYAFCHLRQEQRCFRMDRIETYRLISSVSEEAKP